MTDNPNKKSLWDKIHLDPTMVLILLALFLMRLGFAAEARERTEKRKVHKPQRNTIKRDRRAG